MSYEELVEKQQQELKSIFDNMTSDKLSLIKQQIRQLVNEGVLDREDESDIHSVLDHLSLNWFNDLETHPREQLYRLLTSK